MPLDTNPSSTQEKPKIFQDFTKSGEQLDTDTLDVTKVESFCTNCHDNGITQLLLTKIPFFKELIISSFFANIAIIRIIR